MWKYIKPLLYPLFLASAIGFSLALSAHVLAWIGNPIGLDELKFLMFSGVFVVFFPAVLLQFKLLGGQKIKFPNNPFQLSQNWKNGYQIFTKIFRGCPGWMRKIIYGSFAYAFANFLLNMGNETLLMTGHILPFYAFPAGMYYSALNIDFDEIPTCINGHEVDLTDNYCSECGAPIETLK